LFETNEQKYFQHTKIISNGKADLTGLLDKQALSSYFY